MATRAPRPAPRKGDYGGAAAINDRGQVIGNSSSGNGDPHTENWRAFLWANGKLTRLATHGGGMSYASTLNQRGQVVGWWSGVNEDDPVRAALWENGKLTSLSALSGDAAAINNQGQIVGSAYTKKGNQHAVLWTLKR